MGREIKPKRMVPPVLVGLAACGSLFEVIRHLQPPPMVVFLSCCALLVPWLLYTHFRHSANLAKERSFAAVYRELIDQVNDAILVISAKSPHRILECNQAASVWLGYSYDELLSVEADMIADVSQVVEQMKRKYSPGSTQAEYREIQYRTKDGRLVPAEVNIRMIRLQGQRALLAIGRDLTERKRMENRIRHMAYYDDLTGLPNRRLFREKLEEAMAAARAHNGGAAVLYLDIDRFKLVNDSFGHDYGDMLLMQVAERFVRCIGDDDFLARTEGDEFAMFYAGVTAKERLEQLAEGIYHSLEQPFQIGQFQIHITASIGIAHYLREPGETPDLMMKYADIALSRAKETGKNTHQIFNTDMNKISLTKLTLESELRQAIRNNEFMLVYQPQIHLEKGTLVGMEALIRWNHPVRGMVSPGDFIPIAEETGLIVPIGEWVLMEACRQNKLWQDGGLPAVPVSVNLSMRQFLQHDLKGKIHAVLEDTQLPAHFLELEITESMTMDVEFATKSLKELKSLGLQISIDDFGTGYSSLHFLKKFPIDKLKIDRSFVRDVMFDPNDAAIVATIISMTHHLNLLVIAEGVETREQMHFLRDNQCNLIQGYWYSPPLPAPEMQKMLKQSHPLPA
ncbi:MAG: diguanylate cyclase [Paenibacillaceae bacterium]|nr:diguanylate cyclase [Paenibacillaceae bacterium]